jgi:dUTP pyrophosphatase
MTNAKFYKVSRAQFDGDDATFDAITLPRRATAGSAGYDFFAPTALTLAAGETITVATGIRVAMPQSWVLLIFPRSGLGFKYKLRLANTVGVIDSDYFYSDNEGHIFIKISNEGAQPLTISQGTAFAQGVFVNYLLTDDDDTTTPRNGGMGSTGREDAHQ